MSIAVGNKVTLNNWGRMFLSFSDDIQGMPKGEGEVVALSYGGDAVGARFDGVVYTDGYNDEDEDPTVIWFASGELEAVGA